MRMVSDLCSDITFMKEQYNGIRVFFRNYKTLAMLARKACKGDSKYISPKNPPRRIKSGTCYVLLRFLVNYLALLGRQRLLRSLYKHPSINTCEVSSVRKASEQNTRGPRFNPLEVTVLLNSFYPVPRNHLLPTLLNLYNYRKTLLCQKSLVTQKLFNLHG